MKAETTSTGTKDVMAEYAANCLLMRTRLIARVLTGIYDQALREYGINAPQFSLLVIIHKLAPASSAEIGRYSRQDRSTLTRNLKILADEGWIQESPEKSAGRARPLMLTETGTSLLRKVAPAWRETQAQVKAMLGDANVKALDDMVARIRRAKLGE